MKRKQREFRDAIEYAEQNCRDMATALDRARVAEATGIITDAASYIGGAILHGDIATKYARKAGVSLRGRRDTRAKKPKTAPMADVEAAAEYERGLRDGTVKPSWVLATKPTPLHDAAQDFEEEAPEKRTPPTFIPDGNPPRGE